MHGAQINYEQNPLQRNAYHKPHKINFDGKVFAFGGCRIQDMVYLWVHLIGTPNEARNYYYILEVYGNPPRSKNYNYYSGDIYSVNDSSDKLIQEGKCFGIHFDILRAQFADANNNYKITLSMYKMPLPALPEIQNRDFARAQGSHDNIQFKKPLPPLPKK